MLSFGGGITSREVEEDIVRVEDMLNLQPRKFYMMSYHGRFYGKTINVNPARVVIKFPEAKKEND